MTTVVILKMIDSLINIYTGMGVNDSRLISFVMIDICYFGRPSCWNGVLKFRYGVRAICTTRFSVMAVIISARVVRIVFGSLALTSVQLMMANSLAPGKNTILVSSESSLTRLNNNVLVIVRMLVVECGGEGRNTEKQVIVTSYMTLAATPTLALINGDAKAVGVLSVSFVSRKRIVAITSI